MLPGLLTGKPGDCLGYGPCGWVNWTQACCWPLSPSRSLSVDTGHSHTTIPRLGPMSSSGLASSSPFHPPSKFTLMPWIAVVTGQRKTRKANSSLNKDSEANHVTPPEGSQLTPLYSIPRSWCHGSTLHFELHVCLGSGKTHPAASHCSTCPGPLPRSHQQCGSLPHACSRKKNERGRWLRQKTRWWKTCFCSVSFYFGFGGSHLEVFRSYSWHRVPGIEPCHPAI